MNTKSLSLILIVISLAGIALMLFLPKHVDLDTGRISTFKGREKSDDSDEDDVVETKD